jgi:hypothetical protein
MAADDITEQEKPSLMPSDDTLGALAALRRAAFKAQRDAIATVGSFPTWKDGKVVHVTEVQVPPTEEHLTLEDVRAEYEQKQAHRQTRTYETQTHGAEAVASSD